ncbi:MAG: hypothetical protein RM021_016305 [Nostoc sp. EkiNYC01]|nr:hypothetical protein [Nostoc sp. EkiNYC01]
MLDKLQLTPNKSRVYKKRLTSLFRDESDLGNLPSSVPYKEKCLRIDTPNYDADYALLECRVFKRYIQRLFPIPQELEGQLCYRIRGYSHDFGTEYNVSILYDDRNLEAFNFACNIELVEFPADWDEIALIELRSLRLSSALTNLD